MSTEILNRNQALLDLMLSSARLEFWAPTRRMTRESLASFAAPEKFAAIETVYVVGQGTSLATAMNAEIYLTHIARLNARALAAFEFSRYAQDYLLQPEKTLVVGVSCGGNTKSVEMSLQAAREKGALTVCLSGEGELACARAAEYRIVTDCQIERRGDARHPYSVSHLFLLLGAYELSILIGRVRGALDAAGEAYWRSQLDKTLGKLSCLPALYDRVGEVVRDMRSLGSSTHIALGSGPNHGTMQEGALKISEFCWQFGAGEELEDFAHGRFRELGATTPLLIIAPDGPAIAKTMDVLAGIYLSKTPAIVLTDAPSPAMRKLASHIIEMPRLENEYLTPFVYIFPFWFYGFRVNADRGELVGGARYGLYAVDINFEAHFDEKGERKTL
jgi:glucosamine 6-phosphate synthetase-like amidotransferase/phosphosugar isomerase protein